MAKKQTQEEKNLKALKSTVKQLKKLYSLLIRRYIALLESDGEIKATVYSEINSFLNQQGVSLHAMVDLDALESLKYADSALKGDLDNLTGEGSLTDMELPFGVDERFSDSLQ